jgi:hypothetical protein
LPCCAMPGKSPKSRKQRPPRIRVPNQERAIFTVDSQKFIGIVHRLSLSGGSALLVKGALPSGTIGEMALSTVFGKVTAHVEFLHTGADGVALAQAFRFLGMDDVSSERFTAAAEQMQTAGFSDAEENNKALERTYQSLSKLGESLRNFSEKISPRRREKT